MCLFVFRLHKPNLVRMSLKRERGENMLFDAGITPAVNLSDVICLIGGFGLK